MSSVTVPSSTTEEQPRRSAMANRLSGLAQAIEGTRRASSFNVRQIMLATGATCMGLGIVAIVLGWYGASHSAYLFQEIPYLISGGLLGVALVAGGGFLFFASWLVRMLEDDHRHTARVERTLERVDHVLGAITEDTAFWEQTRSADAPEVPEPPMGVYREGNHR